MAGKYSYHHLRGKLDEIRIVELSPAQNHSDQLHCRLIHVFFHESPQYRALSYTWGTEGECESVIVDNPDAQGQTGKEIRIRPNLDAGLRRIRQKEGSLWIWIDSLCIDQGNLDERGEQAGKMTEIYKKASEVYVWLGEAENESPAAWKLIRDIAAGTPSSISQIIQDPSRLIQFRALHKLFRRPYWTRVWVIQEVNNGGKAVRVFSGEESMSWADLDSVCDKLREAHEELASFIGASDATLNNTLLNGGPKSLELSRFSEEKTRPSLLELLLTHKGKDSTDPKDKVYALVGLSSSHSTFDHINYESSEREVFVYTASHIIRTTNRLDVICVRQNDDNKYNLPSWVPDWEKRNKSPNHRIMGLHIRRPPFRASGNLAPSYEFLDGGATLKCTGFVVDEIGETGRCFHMKGSEKSGKKISQTLSTFMKWWNLYESVRGPQISTGEFSSTAYGGEWQSYSEPLLANQRFESFCALSKVLLPTESLPDFPRQKEDRVFANEQDYRAMVSAGSLRMHGKIFAISSEQKLSCLAPLDTLSGDFICILLGCSFPVILRPFGDSYWLIGEAFVYGIMNSETLGDLEKGKYLKQDFVLK